MLEAIKTKSRRAKLIRYGLFALCFMPLFFIRIQSNGSPFVGELLDGAHIGVFFVVGWVLFPLISGTFTRKSIYLVVITAIASLLIEGIQESVGRAFQVDDIIRNFIGLALGLSLRIRLKSTTPESKRFANIGFAICVTIFLVERFPLVKLMAAQAYFRINAPVLADFDHEFEMMNWKANYSQIAYENGALVLYTTPDKHYSGVFFRDFPADWRRYSTLHVKIENVQDSPQTLTLKITDLTHDLGVHHYDERFNQAFILKPGENHITVAIDDIERAPKSRLLNISEISRVDLFLSEPGNGEIFRIDELYLLE